MSIKMSVFALVACTLTALSAAAPSGLAAVPLAAAPVAAPALAPVAVPAPVVTAYSSQYVARNYNGIAAAPAVIQTAAYVAYPQYPQVLAEEYVF